MPILSVSFFCFLAFSLAAHYALRQTRARRLLWIVLNAFFIASFANNAAGLIPLATFLAAGYGSMRLLAKVRRASLLFLLVGLLIALFCVITKYPPFGGLLPERWVYVQVGASYVMFRIIHLVIDTYEGSLEEPTPLLEYLCYTTFFLSWTTGPIQRVQDFRTEWDRSKVASLDYGEILQTSERLIMGIVKVAVVSGLLGGVLDRYSAETVGRALSSPVIALLWFSWGCFVYFIFLYFNFSGSIDCLIAAARFFGFRLPENFANPFVSTSYFDFWNRWHITLSTWFKYYLFNPTVKALVKKNASPRLIPLWGIVGFSVTFFVVGIWHKPSLHLAFSLGLGALVNKTYQELMLRWKGKKAFKALKARPIYIAVCNALTLSYVSVAICFLWTDSAVLRKVLPWGIWTTFFVCIPLVTLVFAFFLPVYRKTCGFLYAIHSFMGRTPVSFRFILIGIWVYGLIMFHTLSHQSATEFVYQGF